jgi:hypothetical protein
MARSTSGGKDNVHFGPPDRGKDAASRPSRGRPCDMVGCETVLSTYNSSTTCWLHTNATYRHPLARG